MLKNGQVLHENTSVSLLPDFTKDLNSTRSEDNLIACFSSYLKCKQFLQRFHSTSIIDRNGFTGNLLMHAITNERLELATHIIKATPKQFMKYKTKNNETPLSTLLNISDKYQGSSSALIHQIAQKLIKKGALVDESTANTANCVTPLYLAIKKGRYNIAKLILEQNVDVNKLSSANTHSSALHLAVLNNNVEMVILLIQRGANPMIRDRDGYTPLDYTLDSFIYKANTTRSLAHIVLLLSPITQKNYIQEFGEPIVFFTLLSTHRKTQNNLTIGQAYLSITKAELLATAIKLSDEPSVHKILSSSLGFIVTTRDKYNGHTPLHLAAKVGNIAIIKALLLKGASKTDKDYRDQTPYDICKHFKHKQAMKLLKPNFSFYFYEQACRIFKLIVKWVTQFFNPSNHNKTTQTLFSDSPGYESSDKFDSPVSTSTPKKIKPYHNIRRQQNYSYM